MNARRYNNMSCVGMNAPSCLHTVIKGGLHLTLGGLLLLLPQIVII